MTLTAIVITTAYMYIGVLCFRIRRRNIFLEISKLLGYWIEMRSVMGASHALEELAKLMPTDVHKLMLYGSLIDILFGELKAGNIVIVKPDEKVPADGIILDGESYESMLTGESKPVSKKENDLVIGGSINGEGLLKVKVKNKEKIHIFLR